MITELSLRIKGFRGGFGYRLRSGRTLAGMADEDEDAPLTEVEIALFGPVVEAQVWTPAFLAEKRAPIAQAAGRPKLGPVFNEEGVGRAVMIRPCVSRGKRIRGLAPIYTPAMLERDARVFAGWPMFFDHLTPQIAEALREAAAAVASQLEEARSRGVREMGGQILTPYWDRDFVQEDDAEFGYQKGGALAEIWGSPVLRGIVGNNPDLLHTSIAAWPTSGKPAQVPWNPKVKGMAIEGIRRQPQGSVDFVPRGGAGGRLLLAEGVEADPDLAAWPEPRWEEADARLVVSVAEGFYAPRQMTGTGIPNFAAMKPDELSAWVRENQPHLAPALVESAGPPPPAQGASGGPAAASSLTADDVQRMISESQSSTLTADEIEEQVEERLRERDGQRHLAGVAAEMIRVAEGVPPTWKADLTARYAMLPSGPAQALLVEAETDDKGAKLSEEQVLRRSVTRDLEHVRDLIAEATGKPRVKGEGGSSSAATGAERVAESKSKAEVPYWRTAFAELGVVESADDALSIHGVERKREKAGS
jgi:hypothetical protein